MPKVYLDKNTILTTNDAGGINGIIYSDRLTVPSFAVSCANNLDIENHSNLYLTAPGAVFNVKLLKLGAIEDGTLVYFTINGNITIEHNQTPTGDYVPILLHGSANLVIATVGTLTLKYDDNLGCFIEKARCVL